MVASIYQYIFIFVLFFILTPGVVLTLPAPPIHSRVLVAFIHSIIFTILYYLGIKYIVKS
jgi:hypothetical protein